MIVAAGVGLAAFPFTARLTRRLETLRTGVERWGAGELALRVEDGGDDEVAVVARAFNVAAGRVEDLLTSQKALLANASHELRSPLTRLRMAIELWLVRPGPDLVAEIHRNLAESDALVEEILLASRLDHDRTTMATGLQVDLTALAAEEAARFDPGVASLEGSGEPVEIEGDATLLRRLVRNLLENAVKHGRPRSASPSPATTSQRGSPCRIAATGSLPQIASGCSNRSSVPPAAANPRAAGASVLRWCARSPSVTAGASCAKPSLRAAAASSQTSRGGRRATPSTLRRLVRLSRLESLMLPTINRDTTLCMSLSGRPGNTGTRFHNFLYRELGLNYVYKAFTTRDLAAAIGEVRALGVRGCAISMPFKEAVIPLVDEMTSSATAIQSVNTIVNDNGFLRAYNTDYSAVASLLDSHGVPRTDSYAVLGSGGMAKAVASAIRDAGFRDGTIVARNEATGRALAETIGVAWRPTVGDLTPQMIVNVTPIGMEGAPEAEELAFPRSVVEGAATVFDVVALPIETPLVRLARDLGKRVIDGGEVMTLQAVEQFVLYTGVRPEPGLIARAQAFARAG